MKVRERKKERKKGRRRPGGQERGPGILVQTGFNGATHSGTHTQTHETSCGTERRKKKIKIIENGKTEG